ncbi:MAG TPA: hypothetical protein PLS63_08675 [Microthrixaceae bacterium]|jgi:hypothetical protein|nr:hypothetical protein [Microthrixaceae bacterium]
MSIQMTSMPAIEATDTLTTDATAPAAGAMAPTTARPPKTPTPKRRRYRTEIAEGVISTAISVLIVAFLGIALWKGFDVMMNSATDKTQHQVEQIGG